MMLSRKPAPGSHSTGRIYYIVRKILLVQSDLTEQLMAFCDQVEHISLQRWPITSVE